MKKLLYILPLLLGISSFAQMDIQINGATVQNNGATVFIQGNTVSNGSTINNLGSMHFDGNFTQTNNADLLTNQALTDTVFVAGNFDIVNGMYDGSDQNGNGYQGALVFNGTASQNYFSKANNADHVYNLVIDNTGGAASVVTINGLVLAENDIKFLDGKFVVANTDTLALIADGTISGTPGLNSHINGRFYREGSLLAAPYNLFYPVGTGTKYRPATILNHPAKLAPETAPIVAFGAQEGTVAGATKGLGVENLNNGATSIHWEGIQLDGDYHASQVELSHDLSDGFVVADQPNIIVTQSETFGGTYASLDVSNVTASTVTSQFNAEHEYFLLGRSANMRVDLTAFLEGPYAGAGTMWDSLRTNVNNNYLEVRYRYQADSTNPYSNIEMLDGYAPPSGAVDVVMLTLRDPAFLTVDIDTTYAWLMSDGSIRDFAGGEQPYATFKDLSLNPGNNYTVVVWHRNHVPMMYTGTGLPVDQSTGAPTYFDLSNPTNVYGTGYKDLGGIAGLYAGNADQSQVWYSIYEVDAMDYDKVRLAANGGMPVYYNATDINMDAKTNNTDWTITRWANDQLYYSTFPF